MRNDPLDTINKLIQERYKDATAVFWAGSVSKDQANSSSDLDLIIVYSKLPNAYREAYIYHGWLIDAFVNDPQTLHYFFEESRKNSGIPGLMHMIIHGREITEPTNFSDNIKTLAQKIFNAGPAPWDKKTIDTERFFITDVLEDIVFPKNRAGQIASTAWLYEALSQFYFRAQNKWRASGKSIVSYLENDNPQVAKEFFYSFEKVFQNGNTTDLKQLVSTILTPYGGLLWDGFKSDAPENCRILDKN